MLKSNRQLGFVLGLAFLWPAVLSADCGTKCKRPPASADPRVVVDINTGKILEGDDEFPADLQFEVLLTNRNPYKYSYEIQVESSSLEQGLIAEALQRLAILPSPEEEEDANVERLALAQLDLSPAEAAATCPSALVARINRTSTTDEGAITAARGEVNREIENHQAATKKFNAFLESVQTNPADAATCEKRCNAAKNLDDSLKVLTGAALKSAFAKLEQAIETFEVHIGDLAADPEISENAACMARVKGLRETLRIEKASRDIVGEVIAKLPDLSKKAAASKKLLDSIAADPDAFHTRLYISAPSGHTEHVISINRVELDTGAKSTITVKLISGRPRFSISGGIAVGLIGERSFKRQNGIVPDGQGGTKAGSLFAIDDEKDETLAPALQLNGSIHTWITKSKKKIQFAWSLGLMTLADGADDTLGYFTGPSLAFIDGNLYFTLGYYRQKVDSLDGFVVGDPIPDGLADPLPTTSKTKGGFMISVSYRIR
jgi:hypothetical protein